MTKAPKYVIISLPNESEEQNNEKNYLSVTGGLDGGGSVLRLQYMQMIDTTFSYEYAYVALPNGEWVEGKPTGWIDYEDSDVVQIVINGKTYLTHYENVVLVSD